MTKLDVVDNLKTNRAKLRKKLIRGIQVKIELCARSGHFPDFADISEEMMDTIAIEISKNRDVSILEWIVMLQRKEPDKFCKNTMEIVEKSCQEK